MNFLYKLIASFITELHTRVFPDDIEIEAYANEGKLVLYYVGDRMIREVIVSSVAEKTARNPASLQEAFIMQQKVPSPVHKICTKGWQITDPRFRVKVCMLQSGKYFIEKPTCELRHDENCRFEIYFVDSAGRKWIKRPFSRILPAMLVNRFHNYMPDSIPTFYSEPQS